MIRQRGRKARGSEGDHGGGEARTAAADNAGLSLPIFKVWDESTAVRASRPKPKAKTKGKGQGKGKAGMRVCVAGEARRAAGGGKGGS